MTLQVTHQRRVSLKAPFSLYHALASIHFNPGFEPLIPAIKTINCIVLLADEILVIETFNCIVLCAYGVMGFIMNRKRAWELGIPHSSCILPHHLSPKSINKNRIPLQMKAGVIVKVICLTVLLIFLFTMGVPLFQLDTLPDWAESWDFKNSKYLLEQTNNTMKSLYIST